MYLKNGITRIQRVAEMVLSKQGIGSGLQGKERWCGPGGVFRSSNWFAVVNVGDFDTTRFFLKLFFFNV